MEVKYITGFTTTIQFIFEVTLEVKYLIGFTTTIDERKSEGAISREENKRTIDYNTIDFGHFSSPSSINGDLMPLLETIHINNIYNKIATTICFNDPHITQIDNGTK